MSAKTLKGVDIGNIGDEIIKELNAYTEGLVIEVDNAAKRSAKRLREEIIDASPEDTGAYGGSWRIKEIESKTGGPSKYVVHNKDHYRLTHLLEYGHAKNGGTERVKAQPHIEPARDREAEAFAEELERVVSVYGS
jgi:hypothetical protein